MSKTLSRHHIVPKSNGGKNRQRNVVKIPKWFHKYWHALFGDFTVEEILCFIDEIMIPGKRVDADFIVKLCPSIHFKGELRNSPIKSLKICGGRVFLPSSYIKKWKKIFCKLTDIDNIKNFVVIIMKPCVAWAEDDIQRVIDILIEK